MRRTTGATTPCHTLAGSHLSTTPQWRGPLATDVSRETRAEDSRQAHGPPATRDDPDATEQGHDAHQRRHAPHRNTEPGPRDPHQPHDEAGEAHGPRRGSTTPLEALYAPAPRLNSIISRHVQPPGLQRKHAWGCVTPAPYATVAEGASPGCPREGSLSVRSGLVVLFSVALLACPAPPADTPTCPEIDCPSPAETQAEARGDAAPDVGQQSGGTPIIGVSGYVILPGTRGDEGLGRYRTTRTYRDAIVGAGAVPVRLLPVPGDRVDNLLDRIDALVLAGGPDIDPAAYREEPDPSVSLVPTERQDFDFALARGAMERQMPILGICLGSQELNVVRGGSLIQDIPTEVEGHLNHRQVTVAQLRSGVHPIELLPGTALARIYGGPRTIEVNSAHHQASDVLGEGLVATARASDGVVEAFEDPGLPFLIGVQYHPEIQNAPAELHSPLFSALVEAAREYRSSANR